MKNNPKIYLHFILCALPVMVIPVMLMTGAYFHNVNLFRQEVYDKNVSILQNNANIVENTIESMEGVVKYLSESVAVNGFLNYDSLNLDGTNTVNVNLLQKDIKSLAIANDLFLDIHLYSRKSQILLTQTSPVIYLERYYGNSFQIEGMNREEWQLLLETREGVGANTEYMPLVDGGGRNVLLYNSDIPAFSGKYRQGSILIYLDMDKIMKNFENIDYQENGYLYILDKKGNVLYDFYKPADTTEITLDSSGRQGFQIHEVNGRKQFVTWLVDRNGWTYVTAMPLERAERPVKDILFFLYMMLGFTIVIGIVLLHFFSIYFTKPLDKLYHMVRKSNSKLTYHDFNMILEETVLENRQMQDEMQRQIPVLRTSIFHMLLSGRYHERQELCENFEKINIRTDASLYIILLISLNDLDSDHKLDYISAQKIYLKSIMERVLGTDQIYDLDLDKMGILILYDYQEKERARQLCEGNLKTLKRELNNNFDGSISFHGDVVDDVADIPLCFRRLTKSLGQSQAIEALVEWYDKCKQENQDGFYYPIDLREQLSSSISWGNVSETRLVMNKLRRHNTRTLEEGDSDNLFQLILELYNTLIWIIKEEKDSGIDLEVGTSHLTDKIGEQKELQQLFTDIEGRFIELAVRKNEKWKKDNSYLKVKIYEYITENFADSQLSLTMLADTFQLSEVYLSKRFKQFFQQNFSKYVENLRMEQAKGMLEEGEYSIAEISQRVGYNSPQSFRRAFKRVYGITPRER